MIKSPKIHIVSFDIPSPPNYGGAIDVFYKVKSLYELGYKITLHCFKYNDREITNELKIYCEKIFVYKRNFISVNLFDYFMPMIVNTRNHSMLLKNLLLNNEPILFEGLHSTYFLNNSQLKNRIKLVRMHNIEHNYYSELAINEKNILKKIYYKMEAFLLKKYENVLHNANAILAISANDELMLSTNYNNVSLINAFHGFELAISNESKYYALYHGKLNVNENDVAARFLIKNVFSKIDYPFLIAGANPFETLRDLAKKYKHIRVVKNPSMAAMQELINEAHIHVLPTFQATGIKLKLLQVLYNGKFIIANNKMIANTGLESLVIEANSPNEILAAVQNLNNKTFDITEIERRKTILAKYFNNAENALKIHAIIEKLN